MRDFFTRQRFGRPQFLAGTLLCLFFAQAVWLVSAELWGTSGPDESETIRIREGWKQLHGHGVSANPFWKECRLKTPGSLPVKAAIRKRSIAIILP